MSKDKKKSDRFKFRAWHPELGMSNVVMVNNHGFLGYYMNKDMSKETALGEEDGVILMQCTPYPDNSGEEVFEGDIFKFEANSPSLYSIDWSDNEGTWMLYGEPVSFWVERGKLPGVVVGNIHENPELLSD